MRGTDVQQGGMFSYVSLESRVPDEHPLRGIKALLDEALAALSRDFERVYAQEGRPSIPPERLVRASTPQILCTPVSVAGAAAAVAGRPSMDMLTIDVTGLPRAAIGDRVELWGREVPVERVAAACGTIAYELTCRVGRRVEFSTRGA